MCPMVGTVIARHLARAADSVLGAHYLHQKLGNESFDGDRSDEHLGQENQMDVESFLQQVDADWRGKSLQPDVPGDSSLRTIQMEDGESKRGAEGAPRERKPTTSAG